MDVDRAGAKLSSLARVITPGYFDVMGIRLLRGRAFAFGDAENAPRVAIVNENLGESAFRRRESGGPALVAPAGGRPLYCGRKPGEIVGLAANSKELGVDEVPFHDIYLPFEQNPMRSMYLVMKTNGRAEGCRGCVA